MTVADLIDELMTLARNRSPFMQVSWDDGNGKVDVMGVRIARITTDDVDNSGDCDGREGEDVVCLT